MVLLIFSTIKRQNDTIFLHFTLPTEATVFVQAMQTAAALANIIEAFPEPLILGKP